MVHSNASTGASNIELAPSLQLGSISIARLFQPQHLWPSQSALISTIKTPTLSSTATTWYYHYLTSHYYFFLSTLHSRLHTQQTLNSGVSNKFKIQLVLFCNFKIQLSNIFKIQLVLSCNFPEVLHFRPDQGYIIYCPLHKRQQIPAPSLLQLSLIQLRTPRHWLSPTLMCLFMDRTSKKQSPRGLPKQKQTRHLNVLTPSRNLFFPLSPLHLSISTFVGSFQP